MRYAQIAVFVKIICNIFSIKMSIELIVLFLHGTSEELRENYRDIIERPHPE